MDLKVMIRTIPDFPEPGILFRDITTLLQDPDGLHASIDAMQTQLQGREIDVIVGAESRGFIFGMPLAYNLHKGFVLIRKPGKLPYQVYRRSYGLEYGQATVEMHVDAIKPGQKVVIVDDLLATGGTAQAMVELVELAGGQVAGLCFLMELTALKGREVLKDYPVFSVLQY